MKTRIPYLTAFFLLILILMPENASAYLDAGTFSYVIQMALAALAGAIFSVKIFWVKIKEVVGRAIYRQKQNSGEKLQELLSLLSSKKVEKKWFTCQWLWI